MVKKLGANVNQARQDGTTPLHIAARYGHEDVLAFLIKYGANPKLSALGYDTVAVQSKFSSATAAQTQYLEARTHCANPGCVGARNKKCAPRTA
jgi:ankyrin repeat protein